MQDYLIILKLSSPIYIIGMDQSFFPYIYYRYGSPIYIIGVSSHSIHSMLYSLCHSVSYSYRAFCLQNANSVVL